ncbi:uncharacterized protein BT62DRAFT_925611 [Guyanagaster necrorhizus]|uniref:Uncharacterized protein n=1 Tax=Guyanagaster necrorhizus TaxID=856835 RepID=A0A9P7W5X7_9AGAR|nr:uncharacterized protein BT62DRAFT_925611 [Guyanagaster necrorhizus MCA 3950]KAG7453070.1 hypothetical protein BT62DRAFT_925611 [Guyanagaster necrorhizus MCA 3950]
MQNAMISTVNSSDFAPSLPELGQALEKMKRDRENKQDVVAKRGEEVFLSTVERMFFFGGMSEVLGWSQSQIDDMLAALTSSTVLKVVLPKTFALNGMDRAVKSVNADVEVVFKMLVTAMNYSDCNRVVAAIFTPLFLVGVSAYQKQVQ